MINDHFTDSRDTWSLWQAIQTITDYKPPPQACDDDTSLPDALNHFYSWFEMQNDTPAQKLPTHPNDQVLCLSPAGVRKTLSRINPRKAAGPDNIPGHVLKDCVEHRLLNSFSLRLWEPWTQLTPPLSETPYKPLSPEMWTISPPPTLPHHIKNCQTSLCNSKCATHRWVCLYKPTVVTHSPLFSLDTFTLYSVYIIPQNTLYVIYVCLYAHALQITLHCSPASCFNLSLFAHVQYLWGIRYTNIL